MKTTVCILLVMGLLAIGASDAWAAPINVLDQSNTAFPSTGGWVIPQLALVGQGFTPTLSGLDAVELRMNSQGPGAGTALVRIRDGGPGGAILGASASQVVLGGIQVVHFDFASTVALTPGAQHTIEVLHTSGARLGVFVANFNANPYAGGTAFVRGIAQPANDLWFREGLHEQIPEPASLALFGAALLGLGIQHRRRRRA